MSIEIYRGLSDLWCYSARIPGDLTLSGGGYQTEAEAWRRLAAHLAALGHDAPTCPHCGQAVRA